MTPSFNEIEGMLRKAATGAGWPFGLAEEIGAAAAWLVARGFDGVGAALAAIEPGATLAEAERTPEGWLFRQARAVAAGPSVFDLLEADPDARAILLGVDQPLLLIGLAGVAARAYGGGYVLSAPGGEWAEVSSGGAELSSPAICAASEIAVKRDAVSDLTAFQTTERPVVDDTLWRRASALAARTYVPASDASRLGGAGAGLTDND